MLRAKAKPAMCLKQPQRKRTRAHSRVQRSLLPAVPEAADKPWAQLVSAGPQVQRRLHRVKSSAGIQRRLGNQKGKVERKLFQAESQSKGFGSLSEADGRFMPHLSRERTSPFSFMYFTFYGAGAGSRPPVALTQAGQTEPGRLQTQD